MSDIKALEQLTGFLSAKRALSGNLSCENGLTGKVSIMKEYDLYEGEYNIIPKAFYAQTLPTAEKLLRDDIVVTEVPYFETSNNFDGVTVYIAKEVEV